MKMDKGFGAILFDDVQKHDKAWVARADSDQPRRIEGIHELETDVTWLSNIPYEGLLHSGMSNDAFIRSRQFLRVEPEDILEDLGLVDDPDHPFKQDISRKTKILANVFDSVMQWFGYVFEVPSAPLYTLASGIRNNLEGMGPDPTLNVYTVEPLKDARERFVHTRRKDKGHFPDWQRYRLPPIDHAMEMGKVPVPTGKFEKMETNELPPSTTDGFAEWFKQTNAPSLLRITVDRVDSDIADLLHFGGGADQSTSGRRWVTSSECFWMQQHAKLRVHEGIICREHFPLPDPLEAMTITKAHRLSYSFQLFCHNLWAGYCKTTKGGNFNPIQPFIRTHDRIRCFEQVKNLHTFGLKPLGYGAGSVHVAYDPRVEPSRYVQAAREYNLFPPTEVVSDDPEITDQMGPDAMLRELMINEDTDQMLKLDNQAVENGTVGTISGAEAISA